MALKEMYDYISSLAADYTTTELSVSPQKVMTETADKKQVVHEMDDGSVAVVSLSDTSYFTVTLQWDIIEDADSGIIMDFWNDTTKANGRERTFYWQHPTDGHTYTVRFLEPLSRKFQAGFVNHRGIQQLKLRVEGYKL